MKVIFLVILHLMVGRLDCRGKGQITFLRYIDHGGCGAGDTCDFYFKPLKILAGNDTTLHEILKTDDTLDTNTVDLRDVAQLKNPIDIQLPTNLSVSIYISVWDADGVYDDHQRDLSDLEVPFQDTEVSTKAGGDWKYKTYFFSDDSINKLEIKFQIVSCDNHFTGKGCNFCEDNYNTETCNIYCKAVEGNYTCDPATGQKMCASIKTGDNCDECENLQKFGQNCDMCKVGWTGDNCKTCAQNYYPRGQCNVLCQQGREKYTCSDSGDKVCQGNWNGINCDTCSNNYYEETCSKYCKETADYNCTDTGDIVCVDNTTRVEDNCTTHNDPDHDKPDDNDKEKKEDTGMNIGLIGGAGGGGGLLIILLLVVIVLIVRKRRKKGDGEVLIEEREAGNNSQPNGDPDSAYSTIHKELVYSTNTINKQPVYSQLNRPGTKMKHVTPMPEETENDSPQTNEDPDSVYSNLNQQPVYSPVVDDQSVYSHLNGPERKIKPESQAREDGEEYADLTFVKNRIGDDVVMYTNASAEDIENGIDATYITVTELKEQG